MKINKKQKEILVRLRKLSKKLKYPVKRRDCSYGLYADCIKNFGSFNNAKKKAGLRTYNNRALTFNDKAFFKDKDLARIASYLTFDGHIYKNLKAFYFCSKDIQHLRKFEKLIKKKFGISGRYYLNNGGAGKTKTHKFIVFNKKISEKLVKLGIPKGDKTAQDFKIPSWILSSKRLSKEYLKIAFFCEGSNKERRKNPRISVNIAKTENFLNKGIKFMESLKKVLGNFGIRTTNCYVLNKRLRKRDKQISRDIRFRIITEDNNKFINKVGWLK